MIWVETHSGATSQPCDRQSRVVTLRASVSSTEDKVSPSDLGRECWGLKQGEGAQSAWTQEVVWLRAPNTGQGL